MRFDLDAARKSGATDDQIAAFLSEKSAFDLDAARKAGATDASIAEFLAAQEPEQPGIFARAGSWLNDARKSMQDEANANADPMEAEALATFGESTKNAADAARRADLERGSLGGMEAGLGPVTRRAAALNESTATDPTVQRRDMEFDAAQSRDVGGIVSDVAGQLGTGVRQIASTPVSLVAPESQMAQRNQAWAEDALATLSPSTRANLSLASARIDDAAKEGRWEEVQAVGREYFTNPVLMQHFVATTLPSMIGVLGPAKAAQAFVVMRGGSAAAASQAGLMAAGAANSVMTGGDARQGAYDDLLQTFLKSGMPEDEAKSRAHRESHLSAGVGMAFGFLGGRYGAESNLLGGAVKGSAVRKGLTAFMREVGTELPEELAPLVTTNALASSVDGRSLAEDVPATAGQTIIGVGPMATIGAAGAVARKSEDELLSRDINGAAFDPTAIDAEVRRRMSPDFAQQHASRVDAAPVANVGAAATVDEAIAAANAAAGQIVPGTQAAGVSQRQDDLLSSMDRPADPLDAAFARGEQLGTEIQNAPARVNADPLDAAMATGAAVAEEIANAPTMDARRDQGPGDNAGGSAGDTQTGAVVGSGDRTTAGTPTPGSGTNQPVGERVAVADDALSAETQADISPDTATLNAAPVQEKLSDIAQDNEAAPIDQAAMLESASLAAPASISQKPAIVYQTPHKTLAEARANRIRNESPGVELDVRQIANGKWAVTQTRGEQSAQTASPDVAAAPSASVVTLYQTPHKGLAIAQANRFRNSFPGVQVDVVQAESGQWEVHRGRSPEGAEQVRHPRQRKQTESVAALVVRAAPRIDDLKAMAQDAGWAEVGGKLIRDASGSVSRSTWIPHASWFMSGMEARPDVLAQHIDDAMQGRWVPAKSARTIDGMMEWLDDQSARHAPDENSSIYDLQDTAYDELSPRARSVVDAFDDAAPMTIEDEAAAMRAMGFTEQEIQDAIRPVQRGQKVTDEPVTTGTQGDVGRNQDADSTQAQAQKSGVIDADQMRVDATDTAQAQPAPPVAAGVDEAQIAPAAANDAATPAQRSEVIAGGVKFSRAPAPKTSSPTLADLLTLFNEADSIEVTAPEMTEQEIDDDEASFLSDFPEGSRYPRKTRLLERVRRESGRAFLQVKDAPGRSRRHARAIGPFSGYETRAEALEPDSFNPSGSLQIEVFGDEQVAAGLDSEPALTITITPDGDLTINGPSPNTDTFRAFLARGWADRAKGANGEVQPGWSALKDPKNPGKTLPIQQIIPLLADVHARVRAWRGDEYVGLHWSRATGAMGGLAWGDQDPTAVYFSRKGSNSPTAGTGITAESLRTAIADQMPGLSQAVDRMLTRGEKGQRGGLVIIDSADEQAIADVIASKIGVDAGVVLSSISRGDQDVTVLRPNNSKRDQGFFFGKSGLTFMVGPNLTADTAPAVLLHEMIHGQQKADIDAQALQLIEQRNVLAHPKHTREFMGRVHERMKTAGAAGDATEAAAYIVEQAVIEGRQAGFSVIDGKYMDWVDTTLGKRIGNLIRDFVAMVRAWAVRRGAGVQLTVDDLVAIAKAGVKSAARGGVVEKANDNTESGVKHSIAASPPAAPPAALFSSPALPDGKVARTLENTRYAFQDRFIDLKKIQDAIRESGRTIRDEFNPYMLETLMHGKAAYRVQGFMEREIQPILTLLRAAKIELPVFERYLHARHAKERNAQMLKINPNQAELTQQIADAEQDVHQAELDVQQAAAQGTGVGVAQRALQRAESKLSALHNVKPWSGTEAERRMLSGMSDADAAKILADVASGPQAALYRDLGKRIDTINDRTRQELLGYSLETREAVDAMDAMYQHYVPLKREMDDSDLLGTTSGTGAGISIRGSSVKRATGSLRDVDNIFANIVAQREAAIVRGEKNVVAKAMYGLALEHPNTDIWTVIRPDMKGADLARELQAMGLDPADVASMKSAPSVPTINERTGMVEHRINPAYARMPSAIVVRVAGQDRVLLLSKTDDRAVRLAGALRNDDSDHGGAAGFVMRRIGPITRYLASINTQYNPIFGLTNFTRDLQEAMLNLQSTELKGRQKDVVQNVKDSLAGIWNWERGDKSHPWAKTYEEFLADGGATGFRDQFATIEDRAKAIQNEMAEKRLIDRPGIKQIAQLLTDYNTAIENSIRLSAYKAARDAGVSRPKAANLAKDLTVNFNRKGARSGFMASLYAFFNSAAQGIERQLRTLASPSGKKIIAGGLSLGVLQAVIGMLMLGDEWDKIEEFERSKNLILPLPWSDQKYIKIPLPLGFYYIPNMSRAFTEMAVYQDRMGERTIDLLAGTLDAFNPIGASSFATMVSPSFFDPVVELTGNQDHAGRQIYQEEFNSLDPTPGHSRARRTTSSLAVSLSSAINTLTGGDDDVPGLISLPPEALTYVGGVVTGGLGREIGKVAETGEAMVRGNSLPAYRVPLVSRFYGEASGDAVTRKKYFMALRDANQAENSFRGKTSRDEDVSDRDANLAPYARYGRKIQSHIRQLNEIRDQEQDRDRRKEIEAEIVELQRQFVEMVEQESDGG